LKLVSERILLTGASGFLGGYVFRQLIGEGRSLRVVVRSSKVIPLLEPDHSVQVIYSEDIFSESESWWSEVLDGVTEVIHFAWFTEHGKYLNAKENLHCLIGSIRMAQAVVAARVKRFVGIGTCFEYDLSYGLLSIETPLRPKSLYASTKASLFLTLNGLLSINKVEFSWCRVFYLYGEGEDRRRLVPYLREKFKNNECVYLNNAEYVRDYMEVSVAAKRIIDVLKSSKQGPVNICSGIPISIRELTESIAEEYEANHLIFTNRLTSHSNEPPRIVGKI
jgi:nucleoside-diphosphate-sugar epimerase